MEQHMHLEQLRDLRTWSEGLPVPVWKRLTLPEGIFESTSFQGEVEYRGEGLEGALFTFTPEQLESGEGLPMTQEALKSLWQLPWQKGQKGLGDKFTAFAMTSFDRGALIVAQAGQSVKLQASHLLKGTDLVSHYLVLAEPGSQIELVFDYSGDDSAGLLHTHLTLWAKPRSQVKIGNLQRLSNQSTSFQSIYALAEEGAQVVLGDMQLGSKNKASSVNKRLEGQRTEGEIYSIYYSGTGSQADLQYSLNHAGKKTQGRILSKGAMEQHAKKVFRGNLVFDRGATQSVSREEEFCMLLGDKVQADSIPGLFCSEDDVIGEHAASIGRVDENKLFYLKSRGFSDAAARQLIIRGAYEEALLGMDMPELSKLVHERIDELMAGGNGL